MKDNSSPQEEKVGGLKKGFSELQKCQTKGDIYTTTIRLLDRTHEFDFCVLQLRSQDTLIVKRKSNEGEYENYNPYEIGKNLSNLTLKKDEAIWDDNLTRDSQITSLPDELNSFISVPIDDVGTLQVFSTKDGEFSERDVNLLQILANHFHERIARTDLEGELREKAICDQLTGLYNRHYLEEILAKETQRARRYGHTLSFLMMDINEFKEVNDYYSHAQGDKVLKEIGNVLRENVREADTVIRYGGDEFLVLLPETGEGSQAVKKRLREQLEAWNQENDLVEFPITVALGVSNFHPDDEIDIEEKIKEADCNMYKEKENQGEHHSSWCL